MQILEPSGDIESDGEAPLPVQELGGSFAAEQRVLEISVVHEFVDEKHTAPFAVGGEAEHGDEVRGVELGGEEELVVELSLALEGAGVHGLDGNGHGRGAVEGAGENRAETALAEALRERVRGVAEGGVGEAVRWGAGVGGGGGSGVGALVADNLAVEDDQD
jgi:hypothetical protein